MHYDVIIAGAGPAGLACALTLAKAGKKVLILEKKDEIGKKVCAGGITWSGLLKHVPETLVERSFPVQHVFTQLQKISVAEDNPIIATVNRKNLGTYMAKQALARGVSFKLSTALRKIEDDQVIIYNRRLQQTEILKYSFLVGADGSTSKVRRHLNIPATQMGVGINYQLDGSYDRMEWHLHNKIFRNGYAWIFPHGKSLSIGAYAAKNIFSARELKERLQQWAKPLGFDLHKHRCEAGFINYDYRGWDFGNILLAGDAAGLASALTGEGIYPAIVSGEAVAARIVSPGSSQPLMERMVNKHRRFAQAVELTSQNNFLSAFLAELGVALLRTRLLDFTKLEMSP